MPDAPSGAATVAAPPTATPATPAPAAAPVPAAPVPPTAAPAPKTGGAEKMADAYDALDKMVIDDGGDGTNGTNGTDDQQSPGDQQLADDQQQAPPKPGEKPPKAATLRETLDKTKGELGKAQARVKELEAAASKPPPEDPEKKKLSDTLAEREKRLTELEEELKFTDYTKSGDYKTRFEQPFLEAYKAGRDKVASMKLTGEDGAARQGTAQDFDSLMRLTDDDAAAEYAAEHFGNKAPTVMYHRERVQELHRAANNAVEDFRKNGTAREAQRNEQMTKQRGEIAKVWETETRAGIEKYPQWFKPATGDDKGNELLERGFEMADMAFGKPVNGPDGKPVKLNAPELARLHAAIRNKAGAFDRAVYLNGKLKAELRATKKELADYKASEPGGGNGRGNRGTPLSTWDSIEADLNKRAR